MLNNSNMNETILDILPKCEPVGASEPTLLVRVSPTTLSADTLETIRRICKPFDDVLREWLCCRVEAEIARRATEANDEEPAAWLLPWHSWNDESLASSLRVSFSWQQLDAGDEVDAVLREVHHAVVAACGARLMELHAAIERSRESR